MRLTDGAGVDLALDAVGGEVTEKSLRCLARFGCLVNYGNASNEPATLPLSAFRDNRAAMGFSLPATFSHLGQSGRDERTPGIGGRGQAPADRGSSAAPI